MAADQSEGRSLRMRLTESGFEKKGGYISTGKPIASLPKVPKGPAPGAMKRGEQANRSATPKSRRTGA